MIVYTGCISRLRCKRIDGIKYMDITYKSGEGIFAPPSKLVWRFKTKEISFQEFTSEYIEVLKFSFKENYYSWLNLLNSKQPICFMCYCGEPVECHRSIFVEFLKEICRCLKIEFEYLGELE